VTRSQAALALSALATVTACGTFTHYQNAESLGNANWRASASASVGSYKDRQQQSAIPGAVVSAAVARGVGSRLDLGLLVYSYGMEATTKYQVAGPTALAAQRGDWSHSLALAVGGATTPLAAGQSRGIETHVRATYLVTRRLHHCVTTTGFASTAHYFFWPSGGGRELGTWIGVGTNAGWTFTTSMEAIVELSLHRAIVGSYPVDRSVLQLGIAVAKRW
jgi:hypothetical protein